MVFGKEKYSLTGIQERQKYKYNMRMSFNDDGITFARNYLITPSESVSRKKRSG